MDPHLQATQRAAAVLAARANGDLDGARSLLEEFDDPTAMALGFFAVAELAIQVYAADTDRTVTELIRQLIADVANARTQP